MFPAARIVSIIRRMPSPVRCIAVGQSGLVGDRRPVRQHDVGIPLDQQVQSLVDVREVPDVLIELLLTHLGDHRPVGLAQRDPHEPLRAEAAQRAKQLVGLAVEARRPAVVVGAVALTACCGRPRARRQARRAAVCGDLIVRAVEHPRRRGPVVDAVPAGDELRGELFLGTEENGIAEHRDRRARWCRWRSGEHGRCRGSRRRCW